MESPAKNIIMNSIPVNLLGLTSLLRSSTNPFTALSEPWLFDNAFA
jgi:hypothetical protein